MKMRSLFSVMLLAGLLLAAPLAGAWADVYLESEQISQGMPGQPKTTTSIMKQYLTQDAFRIDSDDHITIIDFKKKTVSQLNPAAKTYTSTPIENMGMPAGQAKEMADNPMFKAMMKSMTQSIQVTPTQETKKIAGYNCQKYLVSIMMTQSDYWVSKKVKGIDEMRAIGEKAAKLFEGHPMMQQTNAMEMTRKLDGYPVQIVTQVMGGTMTNTLKQVKTEKIDKNLFKVPKGYKLVKEE